METEPTDDPAQAPDEVIGWADERAAARSERDWGAADERKARIEAAGWKVIDGPFGYELEPAVTPDLVEADGLVRYGDPSSVPSRDAEPASAPASIIILEAGGGFGDLTTLVPEGTEIITVIGPGDASMDGAAEVIATARPFSPGEALEAALRRARGETIAVLGDGRMPAADPAPAAAALGDPAVAVVGASGLATADLRRFVPSGDGSADAVGPGCFAFRRSDGLERRPIDGRLLHPLGLAAWWSLALRDAGEGREPRRAVVVPGLLPDSGTSADAPTARPSREERRDGYRIERRFRGRDDLRSHPPASAGTGPG